MPLNQFDPIYHVLQTEDPVFLSPIARVRGLPKRLSEGGPPLRALTTTVVRSQKRNVLSRAVLPDLVGLIPSDNGCGDEANQHVV
jgi:hypothetical protein